MNAEIQVLRQDVSVQDRIADKIKSQFVELIPDDVFKALVQKELDRFLLERNDYGGQSPSQFQLIIREEIKKRLETELKKELDKPEYQGFFGQDGQLTGGEFAKQLITALTPAMMQLTFASFQQIIIDRVIESLRNSGARI